MALSTSDLLHVLLALVVLMVVAHLCGRLFRALRQPPVIGEIVGGLVLGPTLLGRLAPDLMAFAVPRDGATGSALGVFYNLGLLLLVFLAGGELVGRRTRTETRTVITVTVAGLVLPFGVGLLLAAVVDLSVLTGPRGSTASIALVIGLAVAITSIPVISRIMMDLGIIRSVFARKVLAIAVLEDIVLYVILAVILGLAQAQSANAYGLWALTGIESTAWSAVYYLVAATLFFAVFLLKGAALIDRLAHSRWNVLEKHSPVAFRLILLFACTLLCGLIGIDPIFGALMAGVCMAKERDSQSWESVRRFSLAFFVPVYFALVGFQLNLVRDLDLVFFFWFFAVACLVKSLSVWAGARIAGETNPMAVNLAVALNARGGPGIVLASTTFAAGVINESMFTSLVLLSVITSQIAGWWLGRPTTKQTLMALGPAPAPALRTGEGTS